MQVLADSFVSWFKCYTLAPLDTGRARIVAHEIQAHLVPRGNTSLNTHRNKDERRKKDDLLFSVPVLLLSIYETTVFPIIPSDQIRRKK